MEKLSHSLAIISIVTLLHIFPAYAADCGGSVPRQCGDTVSTDYTMSANLGPCHEHGLHVARCSPELQQGFAPTALARRDARHPWAVILHDMDIAQRVFLTSTK